MKNLHPFLPNSELPTCLLGPLEFGNRDQIDALRRVEAKIDSMAEDAEALESGELKYFDVEIEETKSYTVKVLAEDASEARVMAEDMQDEWEEDGWVDHSFSVTEIKG